MTLSDADVELYARQIVIPEVGSRGQARLLASRALLVGAQEGVRRAALYLSRTGIATDTPELPLSPKRLQMPDCVLVADLSALDDQTRRDILTLSRPIVWYTVDGWRLRSGTTLVGERLTASWPVRPMASSTGAESTLHCIGACEAAARVAAVILGLTAAPEKEIDLA